MNVNYDIAFTHIRTRKKQTLIAALGVTVGIALYIFSNSIVKGFAGYQTNEMFKTVPHIRIYKQDELSKPLFKMNGSNSLVLISNPKITTRSKSINDPYELLKRIKQNKYVTNASPQVNVDVFYINGKSQLKGVCNGVNIAEADAMFNIKSTIIAGDTRALSEDLNAILIGSGIAEKMNVSLGDNLTLLSAKGVFKIMKVAGIFSTGNKATDESKSYISVNIAQSLVNESRYYITDIYASVDKPDSAGKYAANLQEITSYKVENWQTGNADQLAQQNVLGSMTPLISFSIMMVAAFGIYNIMNMTITQKINDIAILKAIGFKGGAIIVIFVTEAIIMGVIGTVLGLIFGAVFIEILSTVYIGPPIGYFPVKLDSAIFTTGAVVGLIVSVGAGFFPARKAAKIDPVEIFRK